MPFYRYECRNCGYEFRFLHRGGIDDQVACPKCESTDLERQPPHVAVQFKGNGYYKTDRANKTSKAGIKAPNGKPASTDSNPVEPDKSGASKDTKSNASSETG